MATIKNQDQEDVKNQDGGTPVTGTAGASDAGNPNPGAGAGPVKQNAAAQNQSGYTDVGSYLNANQAGSEKMGQDVASNLTNKYNETKQGVQTSANDLINQVNQGYTKSNQDLIKQVAADPNAAANNSDTLSQFQGQLNDAYTGPSQWGDYGTQQGKVNEATQYGSLAHTPGGLNVYAQQLEGPMASQGVNQLDSLLIGGNEKSAQAIKAASDPYQTLNDYLGQQNQVATGAIQTGQTEAQNASQGALDAFTGANGTLTNLNNSIYGNTNKAVSDAQAQQALASKGLSTAGTNALSPEVLQSLGLSQEQGSALANALFNANTSQYMTGHNFGAASQGAGIQDLGAYLNQQDPTTAITAANTATSDQYNQMAAIQKLLGGKMGASIIDPANASMAGTAPNASSLNQFNYQQALNDAVNAGTVSRAQAQDIANTLTAQADAAHAASKKKGVWNTIKDVANPLNAPKVLNHGLNPAQQWEDLQKAYKNPGAVPDFTNGGYRDVLPDRKEKDKLGVK
jgi:hypothetical protein